MNRADALVALGTVIDPKTKKKVALSSTAINVVASQGGRSAWAFDVVDIDGSPHAVTAILVNTDDLWQLEAVQIAATPAKTSIKSELAKDAVVPPGAGAKTKIAPGAKGAVERFQKGLLDQESWGADLSARSDSIVIGPSAGEVTRGKKEIKKVWQKRVEAKTRAAISGDIVAATTPDGQIAWVSAPITRVADKEDPTPLRAFAVFEKSGSEWKLIALHEAVAFDQPGSGASFKKILPPAAKPDPVPETTAKKDDKKPKKDDKKAKKDDPKKKAVADETPKKAKKSDDDAPKKAKKSDDDDAPKKKSKKSDDDDDAPKKKTKKSDDDDAPKKKSKKSDDDDDAPKKKTKKSDDDDAPKKKTKKSDDDDDAPKKKTKKSDDDDAPKKKTKKSDDDDAPKKKKKPADDEDDDDAPKKKKKKPADDEEE